MRKGRFLLAAFIMLAVLISCATGSHTTAPKKIIAKNSFPINVISGDVQLSVTGCVETDNRIGGLAKAFPISRSTADKIDQYNREVDPTTLTQTVSTREERSAGDAYYYSMRENERVTVTVSAMGDEAVIECSGKTYRVDDGKDIDLTF
jgi:hypothetical protein